MNPKYPIYVISKGRWDSRLTSKALERMKVPYHIVVEPQEYKYYSDVIDNSAQYFNHLSDLGNNTYWKLRGRYKADDKFKGMGTLNTKWTFKTLDSR